MQLAEEIFSYEILLEIFEMISDSSYGESKYLLFLSTEFVFYFSLFIPEISKNL